MYSVKEIFYTLQGEGANAGVPAVFCRFAGCNLWSGREEDRALAACNFCDTDFVGTDGAGGGKFADAESLAGAIEREWRHPARAHRFVVCTGGEPLLQLDQAAIDALHQRGFRVAIETNGTIAPPAGVDWVCVSPKAGNPLEIRSGDELKLVFPQDGIDPKEMLALDFDNFLICKWSPTVFLEIRLGAKLLAVAVTDVLSDSLSAVYTFFDPEYSARSLGTFAILQQIEHAKLHHKNFVYLGFWLDQHKKMDYKRNFQPLEFMQGKTWRRFQEKKE